MYPTFCQFRVTDAPEDPAISAVAAAFGLGSWRPGSALAEEDDLIEVLINLEGDSARVPASAIRLGLPEDVALGMMDAVEEAIEDAYELEGAASERVVRLQATLDLLERTMAEDEMLEL